ncbi:MAG: squalene synthase HpnC [Alphaproteobacteria bacterium]|nr:squalene synthase HpnC [Alphaproteobacteria bacterium]
MTDTAVKAVETPSGKNTDYENFPVGSLLLPARLRPHVAIFYAYARAIDDIADNPDLKPEDKVARLDGFDKALLGQNDDPAFTKAHQVRDSFAEMGIPIQHCRDLISAFQQDATKLRYRDWDDLLDYCYRSAAPVGRYLLDLHGEDRAGFPASDALCNALQVLNHLQDCQADYRELDRVYLPGDWMAEAGVTVEALDAPAASPGIRQVLDHCLDGCDELLALARTLPGQLRSRRLAMESAAIVNIAFRLTGHLRRRDPLAERVVLSKPEYVWCCVRGAVRHFI